MIFWNDRKLASMLAKGEVSEKEKAKYLIAMNVMTTLIIAYPLVDSNELKSPMYHASTLSTLFVTAFGLIFAFKANKDNQDFSARTFCLGLPIVIKSLTLYFSATIALGVTLSIIYGEEAMNRFHGSYFSKYLVPNILMMLYMWRLRFDVVLIQKIKASGE